MAENSQSPESEDTQSAESKKTSPPSGSSAGTPPAGKNQKEAKSGKGKRGLYGKMSVRLLVDHEHAIRLASVLLERAEDPIHTLQHMVDEAMGRYLAFLQAKKNIDFQGIVPDPKKPGPIK